MTGDSKIDWLADFRRRVPVSGVCGFHGPWAFDTFEAVAKQATCPLCASAARLKADEAEREERAKQAELRRVTELRSRGVNQRHMTKTFDAFVAESPELAKALEAAKKLAADVIAGAERTPSLILSGNPGTGKTHLACAIVLACFEARVPALKANVAQIIRDIKATWAKDSEISEDDVIDRYASAPLLIIDEIGVQHGSDTERMFLFEIINARYESCLPTVLVTNLDAEKLRDEVGERVLDRLREDGGRMIRFTGESWRKA